MEIHPVGVELLPCGWTDIHDDANDTSSQLG